MDEQNTKEVYFDTYCNTCRYKDIPDGSEEPCDECLATPFNYNTHRPVKFEPVSQ